MPPARSRHRACMLATLCTLVVACATRTTPAPTKPALAKPAAPTPTPTPIPSPPAAPKELTDDQVCQADGYDFSAGSEEYDGRRNLDCAVGPGTPCTGDKAHCEGARYLSCYHGRLTMTDCPAYCREVGDDQSITYDGGTCVEQDRDTRCICCDAGQPGCENVVSQPKPKPGPLSPPLPHGRR